MGSTAARLGVAVAATAALSACSGVDTMGAARPLPTRVATTTPAAERPAVRDLADVDPCRLARASRPRDFGIDQATDGAAHDSDAFPGSRACTITGVAGNLTLGVHAVVGEGVDDYTGLTAAEVTRMEVAGLPAAVVRPRRPTSCFAVVDVAEDQMLFFQLTVNDPAGEPEHPQDELCATAPRVAEAGTRALLKE